MLNSLSSFYQCGGFFRKDPISRNGILGAILKITGIRNYRLLPTRLQNWFKWEKVCMARWVLPQFLLVEFFLFWIFVKTPESFESSFLEFKFPFSFPAGINLLKVNKRNNGTRCVICSELKKQRHQNVSTLLFLNIFHTLFSHRVSVINLNM